MFVEDIHLLPQEHLHSLSVALLAVELVDGPDGGSSPPSDGYIEGGGGGRSSIGEGTIAFPARDTSTTAYLLIGGGGGGGTSYSTSGTGGGQGGLSFRNCWRIILSSS